MPITLNGDTGITTPTYNGAGTSEYIVPVTAFKNRIINGAMMIDQRNAGASVTATNSVRYTVDRFACFAGAPSGAGVFTAQQVSDAPAGFTRSLKATVTTADTTASADSQYFFAQYIEGNNIADLGFGSASASSITLSFWVKSSLTGTFAGGINNSAANRSYVFTYTINSANTWEYKTITISGDTTGTWLTDTGIGFRVNFSLGSGSTFQASAGSWVAAYDYATSSSVRVIGTLNATFQITGVQLEKGSTATSFDYRPYGTELALCQRYYQTSFEIGTAPTDNVAKRVGSVFNAYDASNGWCAWIAYPVRMRATPTVTFYRSQEGATNGQWATYDGSWTSLTTTATSYQTEYGMGVAGTRTSAFAQYRGYLSSGNYAASAEL